MTEDIKTFSQALPILVAHGIEPKSIGNKQWSVGVQTLDKGGVIRYARELAATDVAPAQSPPTTLSTKMQAIARDYLAAREKAGESLLTAAHYLAEARAAAKHGEWGLFLVATNTSEGTAKRWLDIHEAAERDAKFADGLRSGRLAFTVAAELAQPSTPPALIEAALAADEPPTVAEVRAAKSAIVADLKPNIPELPTDPTDDQVTAMRERFYALGYEQFYASDAGWTAYHPKTKKANYKTWPDVEADIARKEAMVAAKICDGCGGAWGRPGSLITSEGRLCQDCAAARLSSGKPFESAPAQNTDQLPPDFDDVQRRYAVLGTTLTYDHHRGFIMRDQKSGAGIVDPSWATVVATLETRERGRAALAASPDGRVPEYADRSAVTLRLYAHGWHMQSHFGHEGTIWLIKTAGTQEGSRNMRDWAAVVAFADQLDGVTTPTHLAPVEPPICEECGAAATNKRAIGGVLAQRCDACAARAAEREHAAAPAPLTAHGEAMRALIERAEELGATINPTAYDDAAFVQVIPPKGYQQAPLRCDAADLARLVERWAANAASGTLEAPKSEAGRETIDWSAAAYSLKTEIGLMAMNALRTPRDYAAALLRGLAAVMPHIQTESLEDLSQAIADLNECQEGTEAQHWIGVGWALLDLEPTPAASPDPTMAAAAGAIATSDEVTR